VLNAFRRQRSEQLALPGPESAKNNVLNAFRRQRSEQPVEGEFMLRILFGAQRLSASKIGTASGDGIFSKKTKSAQRLSASKIGTVTIEWSKGSDADMCSTPFGVKDRNS